MKNLGNVTTESINDTISDSNVSELYSTSTSLRHCQMMYSDWRTSLRTQDRQWKHGEPSIYPSCSFHTQFSIRIDLFNFGSYYVLSIRIKLAHRPDAIEVRSIEVNRNTRVKPNQMKATYKETSDFYGDYGSNSCLLKRHLRWGGLNIQTIVSFLCVSTS